MDPGREEAAHKSFGVASDKVLSTGLSPIFLGLLPPSRPPEQIYWTVLILTDNTTTMSYINLRGGTHSYPMTEIARSIWAWALDNKLTVLAEYIPRGTNLADFLSRRLDCSNWSLMPSVYVAVY